MNLLLIVYTKTNRTTSKLYLVLLMPPKVDGSATENHHVWAERYSVVDIILLLDQLAGNFQTFPHLIENEIK